MPIKFFFSFLCIVYKGSVTLPRKNRTFNTVYFLKFDVYWAFIISSSGSHCEIVFTTCYKSHVFHRANLVFTHQPQLVNLHVRLLLNRLCVSSWNPCGICLINLSSTNIFFYRESLVLFSAGIALWTLFAWNSELQFFLSPLFL